MRERIVINRKRPRRISNSINGSQPRDQNTTWGNLLWFILIINIFRIFLLPTEIYFSLQLPRNGWNIKKPVTPDQYTARQADIRGNPIRPIDWPNVSRPQNTDHDRYYIVTGWPSSFFSWLYHPTECATPLTCSRKDGVLRIVSLPEKKKTLAYAE